MEPTIFEWLDQNLIPYQKGSEIDFTIPNVGLFLVVSDKDEVFNESFDLVLDDEEMDVEVDFYCYKFGRGWYYTPKKSIDRVTLTPLKYVGKSVSSLNIPEFPFLGVHGGFDLLNGSREYGSWVNKAKFLGIDTLGIVEKNTLGGSLKFQLACNKGGVKPIIGMQIVVKTKSEFLQLKCYVKDKKGWENLLSINKEINVLNEGFVDQKRLLELTEGLFVVIDPKYTTHTQSLPYSLHIPELFWQIDPVTFNNDDRDKQYLLNVKDFLQDKSLQPILIYDAYYLDRTDFEARTILGNIADKRDYASSTQYFKSIDEVFDEITLLFEDKDRSFDLFAVAVENAVRIGDECKFTITLGNKLLPAYKLSEREKEKFDTNSDLFYFLIEKGLRERIGDIDGIEEYLDRIETECKVIEMGGFVDYFLILWDLKEFCVKEGILRGIGRGSGGGSLIAYLLEITHVNPLQYGLLFERFLNEGRIGKSLPDIDIDHEGRRREEVKRYMELRYGEEQVCSVGTYTTLKMKAALKDLGRQKNLSVATLNYINAILEDDTTFSELFHLATSKKIIKSFILDNPELVECLPLILNQPRSKSIHACATLILPDSKDIFHWIPVRTETIKDNMKMLVSEWEGPELESAGFLKEDILGIKQLDKFASILKFIKKNYDRVVDIYNLPLDDVQVYEYFQYGYNGDVFHFGSKGLTEYCKDLQPYNIEDLIAGIALYRPGAMESNSHNEYVLRKKGEREVEYIRGTEEITRETYGLITYQEQVMRACQEIGGFTLVEADDIRKAMGKKVQSLLDSYAIKFTEGGVKKGFSLEELKESWDILVKFGSYGFNKSHAAAYAMTGYICQWLKVHYPVEFWTVAFDFAAEDQIPRYITEIHDLKAKVQISPPDINRSGVGFNTDFKTGEILWSLTKVRQCGDEAVKSILEERSLNGEFFSLIEFLERVPKGKVNKQVVESLIFSGAFDKTEGIKSYKERVNLLETFKSVRKVKKGEVDLLDLNKEKINFDWWWLLTQRNLCGYGYFDYKGIIRNHTTIKATFLPIDIIKEDLEGGKRVKGLAIGFVREVVVKISKKGEFAQVLMDHNYEPLWVIFWSEIWDIFKPAIEQSKGKLLAVSGSLVYDAWRKQNVIQTEDFTQVEILE